MTGRSRVLFVGAAVALGCAVMLQLAAGLQAPLGYDEAYNLQVVINLLHGHGYATNGALYGTSLVRFDPLISTGPTLLLPIAAMAGALGPHLWVLRLVPCLGYVGLLIAWGVVGHRAVGRWGAAAGVAGVVLVDTLDATWTTSQLVGPGDVLGEVTASFLVVTAALCYRRPFGSGLLAGAGAMCKVLVLLAWPPLALLVALSAGAAAGRASRLRSAGPRAVLFLAGAAVPPAIWQLVRIAVLGWDGALEVDSEWYRVFVFGGSGMAAGMRDSVGTRLTSEAGLLPTAWIAVALTLLLVLLGWSRPRLGGLRLEPSGRAPLLCLVAAGFGIELWWLFLADRGWVRHVVPAAYMLIPALVVLAVGWLRTFSAGRLRTAGAVSIAAALTFAVFFNVWSAWHPPTRTSLAQQREMANRLGNYSETFTFTSYYQAPELVLLGGPAAVRLPSEAVRPKSGTLLVVTRWTGGTPNPSFREELAWCGEILVDDGDMVACRVSGS